MNIKEELNILLNNFIITKEYNKEDYYKIKSKIKSIREFVTNKLGLDVIVNSNLIKLEKIPPIIDKTFKIDAFDNKKDYIFFILIIMYLEDKSKEEQFILSNLVSFIKNNLASIKDKKVSIDFNDYSTRKSLTDVIKYVTSLNIIKLIDGDEDKFKDTIDAEVLYENTGISRYVVRQFRTDIFNFFKPEDFLMIDNLDEVSIKRYSTYRALLFYPIFNYDEYDNEIINYFKYYNNRIKNDINDLFDGELIIYNNMAILTSEEKNNFFPDSKKMLHDLVLLVNNYLKERENLVLNKQELEQLMIKIHNENKDYFNKEYREMKYDKFISDVINIMESYKLVKVIGNTYYFSEAIYLIYGEYTKQEEIEVENVFDQLEMDLGV